jgi:hypothetical protein
MENRQADNSATRRLHNTSEPADFLALKDYGATGGRKSISVDAQAEEPFLQAAPCGCALDGLLTEVATLAERDRGIKPGFERDGLVGRIDANAGEAVFDAEKVERVNVNLREELRARGGA